MLEFLKLCSSVSFKKSSMKNSCKDVVNKQRSLFSVNLLSTIIIKIGLYRDDDTEWESYKQCISHPLFSASSGQNERQNLV